MPHPYVANKQYEITLKNCTLYKGRPYGLAIMELYVPENKFRSFKGIGYFTDG